MVAAESVENPRSATALAGDFFQSAGSCESAHRPESSQPWIAASASRSASAATIASIVLDFSPIVAVSFVISPSMRSFAALMSAATFAVSATTSALPPVAIFATASVTALSTRPESLASSNGGSFFFSGSSSSFAAIVSIIDLQTSSQIALTCARSSGLSAMGSSLLPVRAESVKAATGCPSAPR